MSIVKNNYFFAAADYSCGTYGAGNYNAGQCTGANPGTQPGGGLADTGYDVLIPIFLGISLLVAGVILVTRRLLRKRKAAHTFQA